VLERFRMETDDDGGIRLGLGLLTAPSERKSLCGDRCKRALEIGLDSSPKSTC